MNQTFNSYYLEMQELLNNLIKKGRKPFGWDDKLSSLHKEYGVGKWYIRFHNGMDSELFDLRQLTAKESGLWQFVCENKLVKDLNQKYTENDLFNYYQDNYHYWLIKSALCNEEDLEKFLLDNIKI